MSSRARLTAGILGPVLFALVTLAEGIGRPGYSPVRQLISELSLTSRGWIQIANFIVTGALLVVFATGLRATIHSGPAAVWGPRWITAAGAALIAAGVFVTDPRDAAAPTWHGVLHDVAGPLVFLSLAMAAFVYARRFARPWGIAAGVTVIAGFVAASTLLALAYAGTWPATPAGLAESVAVYSGLAWLLALGVHGRSLGSHAGTLRRYSRYSSP